MTTPEEWNSTGLLNDANNTGNYCQLLLATGQKDQGRVLLDRAFCLNPSDINVLAELWFYRLAHFTEEYPEAEQKIRELLQDGACSAGWNFTENIARAELEKHPNIPLLRELADAISGTTQHSKNPNPSSQ